MKSSLRRGVLAAFVLLAGCASTPRVATLPPARSAPATAAATSPALDKPPETAITVGTRPGPALASLPGYAADDPTLALAAFRRSCPSLQKRVDLSGLTQPGDWAAACAAAATATDARGFFASALVPVTVASGTGLNTGYYEPELAGSRTAATGYAVPLYRRPADIVEADLGQFNDMLKGRKIRGRVVGNALVPYWDRGEIDDGALAGRGLELAWAADPYEVFFLEIQGSGRLRLPDGSVMRVGFDGQNGRDYTGIGKLLRDRNALGPGQATMDGIIGWMRAQPDGGKALMRENRSKIFFRELKGDPSLGPPGAMGVPLTPRVSVAADPRFVPLGAPLWLSSRAEGPFARLMVAQDTGGAIKGPNRVDIFWGAGTDARRIAGGLSATGTVTLLLPAVSAARLSGAPAAP